jgi:hypothetical protein
VAQPRVGIRREALALGEGGGLEVERAAARPRREQKRENIVILCRKVYDTIIDDCIPR